MEDYFSTNQEHWNAVTQGHIESDFYNNEHFKKTRNSLNEIEQQWLGNVEGKSLLHLQCHFGQDTLSWQNKGAQCTGIDFAEAAIDYANKLAVELQLPAKFICCNVYDTYNHVAQQYDIVFTSYGTIGWLPDLQIWADQVSKCLKPGGVFLIVDFHPVLWMLDNEMKNLKYPYFNIEPIIESSEGSYADKNSKVSTTNIGWNHPLSDIISALIGCGLNIDRFSEFDYSNYNCFNNSINIGGGKFQIKGLQGALPIMYAVKCSKPQL